VLTERRRGCQFVGGLVCECGRPTRHADAADKRTEMTSAGPGRMRDLRLTAAVTPAAGSALS